MTSGCGCCPSYLQQLEMESNGKSVKRRRQPVGRASAPVTWGGTGTDAQHAVFQLLHQGTHLVPVEFVAVARARIRRTRASPPAAAQLLRAGRGADAGQAERRSAAQLPGDRPSATLLLDRLDPRTLGALLAFYEHRTFANAVLLGINPFDQFGVELGKEIARELARGASELRPVDAKR
jgi:glucose-6-phosphate isomerase